MFAHPPFTTIATILNVMTRLEMEPAMDRHRAWGQRFLDLKGGWFGAGVEDWTTEQVAEVAAAASRRRLRVLSLSSCLGKNEVEHGEAAFRAAMAPLANLLATARTLTPAYVRLVAPSLAGRAQVADAAAELGERHPWYFPLIREAVDRIEETGATVVFENESPGTAFGHPAEVLGFFRALDRPRTRMIWDVGNWWHFGCARFPTVADARALLPVIGVLHLKGGEAESPGGPLRWAAQLATTTWDVVGIVRTVLDHSRCPVVCVNPPHGAQRPGVTIDYRADLDFLRATFPEIEP